MAAYNFPPNIGGRGPSTGSAGSPQARLVRLSSPQVRAGRPPSLVVGLHSMKAIFQALPPYYGGLQLPSQYRRSRPFDGFGRLTAGKAGSTQLTTGQGRPPALLGCRPS